MYKIFNFIFAFTLLFFPVCIFAQQPAKPASVEERQKEMEKQYQEMKNKQEKMQEEQLERLKRQNPQLYKERKAALDNQAKIDSIVFSFRQGKISASEAERQLYPLIKESMQGEIDVLPKNIERLEKQLEFLKKTQKNPDLLIKKRIDEMLGKASHTPEEVIYR
jgi:septal ring factor EnvC (AmiA/AmiB activator)